VQICSKLLTSRKKTVEVATHVFSILNHMAKSQIKQLFKEIQINACIELMRNDCIASNSENVISTIEGDVLKY
jgi:hypothetical protein